MQFGTNIIGEKEFHFEYNGKNYIAYQLPCYSEVIHLVIEQICYPKIRTVLTQEKIIFESKSNEPINITKFPCKAINGSYVDLDIIMPKIAELYELFQVCVNEWSSVLLKNN